MRALSVEYHAPARFDDLIEAFVRVKRIGRTSMTYECAAYRLPDDLLMVTAELTVVLVDLARAPADSDPGRDPRDGARLRGRRPRGVSRAYGNAERVLAEGGEADEVLRALVETLAEEPGIDWAGVAFLDEGLLVLGPRAGEPDETRRTRVAVRTRHRPSASCGSTATSTPRRSSASPSCRGLRPRRLGHRRRELGAVEPGSHQTTGVLGE